VQDEIITPDNFSTIEWHDNYFKYCNFEGLTPSAGHIDSDLNACSFKDIDWYWGLFNMSNFIECRFENCIFRGSGFPDCKFAMSILGFDFRSAKIEIHSAVKAQSALPNILLILGRVERDPHVSSLSTLS